MFYVYIHTKKTTGEVFYVGKGKKYRPYAKTGRNNFWHAVVKKHDFVWHILEAFSSEQDAFSMERYLIESYLALGVKLANLTLGGEGVSGLVCTEAKRKRLSESHKGKKPSAETRQRMSAAQRKRKTPAEVRIKQSKAAKGRKRTQEQIAKHKAALTGRTLSDEHKVKLKLAWERRKKNEKQGNSVV